MSFSLPGSLPPPQAYPDSQTDLPSTSGAQQSTKQSTQQSGKQNASYGALRRALRSAPAQDPEPLVTFPVSPTLTDAQAKQHLQHALHHRHVLETSIILDHPHLNAYAQWRLERASNQTNCLSELLRRGVTDEMRAVIADGFEHLHLSLTALNLLLRESEPRKLRQHLEQADRAASHARDFLKALSRDQSASTQTAKVNLHRLLSELECAAILPAAEATLLELRTCLIQVAREHSPYSLGTLANVGSTGVGSARARGFQGHTGRTTSGWASQTASQTAPQLASSSASSSAPLSAPLSASPSAFQRVSQSASRPPVPYKSVTLADGREFIDLTSSNSDWDRPAPPASRKRPASSPSHSQPLDLHLSPHKQPAPLPNWMQMPVPMPVPVHAPPPSTEASVTDPAWPPPLVHLDSQTLDEVLKSS